MSEPKPHKYEEKRKNETDATTPQEAPAYTTSDGRKLSLSEFLTAVHEGKVPE
jgi:hypothetical protein